MTDLMIVLIVLAVVGGAGRYIYKAKKSGAKCIGCPAQGGCSGCSCGCQKESE